MAKKDPREELDVVAGVIPPEFHADFAKIHVTAGGVKVWAFSDQSDPTNGHPSRVPACIVAFHLPAFDLFLADCLAIRAAILASNGKPNPPLKFVPKTE